MQHAPMHSGHSRASKQDVTAFRAFAVFEHAQALTNGEVSAILGKIVAAKKQEDPAYQPNPLLVKTQEYVDRFSVNKSEAVNQQVRE